MLPVEPADLKGTYPLMTLLETVRLIDRQGTFVGFADVPLNTTTMDLPRLPEVISPKAASGRVFVRVQLQNQKNFHIAHYQEQSFAWAEEFRMTVRKPMVAR